METLERFDPRLKGFSRWCRLPQSAQVRNGLDVLHAAKAAESDAKGVQTEDPGGRPRMNPRRYNKGTDTRWLNR